MIKVNIIYIYSLNSIYKKIMKIIKLNYLKFLMELHLILIYLMKQIFYKSVIIIIRTKKYIIIKFNYKYIIDIIPNKCITEI